VAANPHCAAVEGTPIAVSLVLENVRFAYGDRGFALAIPRLQIAGGESVALVGPSGSGKTTLLNLIAGILTPDRGSIRLGDEELIALSGQQRRQHRLCQMGMIFQSFELLDYLDVRDNILLQARLAPGVAITPALEEQARAVAGELGLEDKWRRRITALSQGERQRVAACRALLLNPDLVLADEPTGNLDPNNKLAVLDQLISLCKRHQRILLTVTHDHSLLPSFDRVVDMAALMTGEADVA
jgi:putative ABC transport system ATP-binding protein